MPCVQIVYKRRGHSCEHGWPSGEQKQGDNHEREHAYHRFARRVEKENGAFFVIRSRGHRRGRSNRLSGGADIPGAAAQLLNVGDEFYGRIQFPLDHLHGLRSGCKPILGRRPHQVHHPGE